MSAEEILKDTRQKMSKGVEFFSEQLKGLRSGRVTPAPAGR